MRRRKPLVGVASLASALVATIAVYKLLGDSRLAVAVAGVPTFVAPAYYTARRRVLSSAAAGVLAPMASASMAWLGLHLTGASGPGLVDVSIFFLLGLLSGGLASHVAASIVWAHAIELVYEGVPEAIVAMAGGLALGFATSAGSSLLLGVAKSGQPRLTPGLAVVVLSGLIFLLVYQLLSSGTRLIAGF